MPTTVSVSYTKRVIHKATCVGICVYSQPRTLPLVRAFSGHLVNVRENIRTFTGTLQVTAPSPVRALCTLHAATHSLHIVLGHKERALDENAPQKLDHAHEVMAVEVNRRMHDLPDLVRGERSIGTSE